MEDNKRVLFAFSGVNSNMNLFFGPISTRGDIRNGTSFAYRTWWHMLPIAFE